MKKQEEAQVESRGKVRRNVKTTLAWIGIIAFTGACAGYLAFVSHAAHTAYIVLAGLVATWVPFVFIIETNQSEEDVT